MSVSTNIYGKMLCFSNDYFTGWLDYSMDCEYIQKETHERILSEYDEVRKMLISMINNSDKWCL
ncbi:MAG TPA: hypothetical protein VIK14_10775 [Ignavibacteria bacterium]